LTERFWDEDLGWAERHTALRIHPQIPLTVALDERSGATVEPRSAREAGLRHHLPLAAIDALAGIVVTGVVSHERGAAAAGVSGTRIGEAEAPAPVTVLEVEDGARHQGQAVLLDYYLHPIKVGDHVIVLGRILKVEEEFEAPASSEANVDPEH
jgi:hypothetical protein